ncbi:hypothetical protein ACFW6C_07475 [Streptomyces fungicidicus]|uniref:hypothetical protein n=1 Tax=Streptomyces fungicidicus TaxID=68203 RepID=UPI0036A7BC66
MMDAERRRKLRRRQDVKDLGWVLLGVLALLLVIGNVGAYYLAPCDSLGWMPVKSAPLRCVVGEGQ